MLILNKLNKIVPLSSIMSGYDKKYSYLPHTSDIYIVAYGLTLGEAFENAAEAMFNVITDISEVRPTNVFNIHVSGIDEYSLLYNWLEELLYLFDTTHFVFSKFKVYKIEKENLDFILNGEVYGEPFNPAIHKKGKEIKSPTYSLMEISQLNSIYAVKFVLDI